MLSSEFAEDLFIEFFYLVSAQQIVIQSQDYLPLVNFYDRISVGSALTKNQAKFVIMLLDKYKAAAAQAGIDYASQLCALKWRTNFRVLDLGKRIYVEMRENKLEICVKFPYQLKKEFDAEIDDLKSAPRSHSFWDAEHKVRRLDFYHYNLIALHEFVVKHNFEIDDTFMNALADVEEIWQNSEHATPHSHIDIHGVQLKNANESANAWWQANKSHDPHKDLVLAKSMGFVLNQKPQNLLEKICHSQENSFWIKDMEEFLQLTKLFTGKICVLLDRSTTTMPWLQSMVAACDKNGVSRDEIKVCFRDNKDSTTGINAWIKAAGVGGSVDTGKILIFESKPAKWLFKPGIDVTMLVTNNIFPPTNSLARDWFSCHPCVIYLGDSKPTESKGQKIVEL